MLARVLVRRHAQELLPHDGAARAAQQMRQHRVHPRQPLICARWVVGPRLYTRVCRWRAHGGAWSKECRAGGPWHEDVLAGRSSTKCSTHVKPGYAGVK